MLKVVHSLIIIGILFQISLPLTDNTCSLNIVSPKDIAQSPLTEALVTLPLIFHFYIMNSPTEDGASFISKT